MPYAAAPYAAAPYGALPEPAESALAGGVVLDAAQAAGGFVGAPVVAPQFAAAFGAAPFGALTFGGEESGTSGTLSGGVQLDDAQPGGVMGTGPVTVVSGNVDADAAQAAGSMTSVPPGQLSGDVPLAPAAPGGTLSGDTSGVLPPLTPGRRMLYAGRQVPQKLPVLDVGEVDNLSADFGNVFDAELEHVIDATVSVEARVGADWHPAPLLVGLRQLHGQKVRQRISGALGVVGVTYLVRVTALSSTGRVALAAGFVRVVRQA